MPLLDLPPELLALIAQHIGPSELRKYVPYLLVAKSWYRAVLPVYLSHLPLSDLYIAAHHDLDRLPPADTELSGLIQARVQRLSVRLVGYPCRCPSVAPWHDDTTNTQLRPGQDGMKKSQCWYSAWTTTGLVKNTAACQDVWRWQGEMRKLHQWGGRINKKLVELAAILRHSKAMKEFSLEASSEDDDGQVPRWDYLHDTTIRILISSLPSNLCNLTLDMCGSKAITPDRGREAVHLCPLLAERLHDFQNVRLRLRCICPQVFQSSSSRTGTESKLKTLVIRLSLPSFSDSVDEPSKGNDKYDAKPCDVTANPLYKRMIAAGAKTTKDFPGLLMMRISYRSKKSICLNVADCVGKRIMCEGSERFCYEDDGVEWDAWENSESMLDIGSLLELR